MKLSRLITYKHMVEGLSIKHVYDEIFTELENFKTSLNGQDIDFENLKEQMATDQKNILAGLDSLESNLKDYRKLLNEFFDSIEGPYYAKSMQIYQEGLRDPAEYILDRYTFKKLLYEPETAEFFINRIKMYTDWKYPAMEIRPALGEITDFLVACDPLYLVDLDPEMFKVVKQKWNPGYQSRLRYYTIDETQPKMFHQLPATQFGLVVAVDFFNFRPFEIIEPYLKQIFHVLRPGGTAVFTYNNCDHPIGVDNFENSYYCYTPGHEMKALCERIGFKVTASFDLDNNVSWLEIRRPGTLSSLRGGQTLGKILNI